VDSDQVERRAILETGETKIAVKEAPQKAILSAMVFLSTVH